MTVMKVVRMGHPVLMDIAKPVEDPTSAKITTLVDDMLESMLEVGGIGLAAPQVAVPLRLVIYRVPKARMEEGEDALPLTVLINPEIEPIGDETDEMFEGCLSLPGMTGRVRRYKHIRYKYTDINGDEQVCEASGFHARVIQHECDHLDGILYPMRMDDMSSFGYVEDMQAEDTAKGKSHE